MEYVTLHNFEVVNLYLYRRSSLYSGCSDIGGVYCMLFILQTSDDVSDVKRVKDKVESAAQQLLECGHQNVQMVLNVTQRLWDMVSVGRYDNQLSEALTVTEYISKCEEMIMWIEDKVL